MIIDVAMMYLLQSVVHCVLPGPHTSNRREKYKAVLCCVDGLLLFSIIAFVFILLLCCVGSRYLWCFPWEVEWSSIQEVYWYQWLKPWFCCFSLCHDSEVAIREVEEHYCWKIFSGVLQAHTNLWNKRNFTREFFDCVPTCHRKGLPNAF